MIADHKIVTVDHKIVTVNHKIVIVTTTCLSQLVHTCIRNKVESTVCIQLTFCDHVL